MHTVTCSSLAAVAMNVNDYVRKDVKASPSLLESAISSAAADVGYATLKDEQKTAVAAALRGQNVFVNVPTGFGKSAIYQVLPMCAKRVLEGQESPAKQLNPFVLVVSPLVSLMQDQVDKLNKMSGAKAVFLSRESSSPEDILDAQYTHLFASPEAILGVKKWRDILHSSHFSSNLLAIAIDEPHCIVKWLTNLYSSFMNA